MPFSQFAIESPLVVQSRNWNPPVLSCSMVSVDPVLPYQPLSFWYDVLKLIPSVQVS